MLRDELAAHLQAVGAAPFLFVGSGIPRRYLGLPGWEELLGHFASVAGKEYAFYKATAGGDNAETASLIAADLHDPWWNTDAFIDTKLLYASKEWANRDSALKAEVSALVGAKISDLSTDPLHVDELDLLRDAVVDGIITTNYDPLLESLFPTFKEYVGEDGLLFSDAQGVGEIYKIHGSHEDPDSLVLTTADYERFAERKPYLAAKLLTIFVERPVVFLGYSLSDPNVLDILRSIATALNSRERIEALQDRLVFVEWSASPPATPTITRTVIPVEGIPVPVQHVVVGDFIEVFAALTTLQRRFSARLLRHLREQVYELVRDEDPHGRVVVVDINDTTANLDDLEMVIGVGVGAQFQDDYRGKNRNDLLYDVVEKGNLTPRLVVRQTLPTIDRKASVPVFKYLRALNLLDDAGMLLKPDEVDPKIAARVAAGFELFKPKGDWALKKAAEYAAAAGDFATLVANHKPDDVIMSAVLLPISGQDPEALRKYLLEHRDDQFVNARHSLLKSQWAKTVGFYDWLMHGPVPF